MLIDFHTGRLAGLAMLAMLAMLAPSLAAAHDVTAGTLVIHQPWTRATPGGAEVAGGYLTIDNRGTVPDRLTGGSFDAATGFGLHIMATEGGVMTMRPTGPLAIPAGGSLTLDPGGRHIMFTGLKRGLRKGEAVAGTLLFDHAGAVPVTFAVEAIGARAPGRDASSNHAGHAMPGMDMN